MVGRIRHSRRPVLSRTLCVLIVTTLGSLLVYPTLLYGRAAWISGLDHVALQQQLNEEMIGNLGYPELLASADQVFFSLPERADLAILALQRVLEIDGRDGSIWARLAYAHAANQGGWTGLATDALTESYQRMPYADREFMLWRLRLAESYWSELPESLRADVVREARLASAPWRRTYVPRINARLRSE